MVETLTGSACSRHEAGLAFSRQCPVFYCQSRRWLSATGLSALHSGGNSIRHTRFDAGVFENDSELSPRREAKDFALQFALRSPSHNRKAFRCVRVFRGATADMGFCFRENPVIEDERLSQCSVRRLPDSLLGRSSQKIGGGHEPPPQAVQPRRFIGSTQSVTVQL